MAQIGGNLIEGVERAVGAPEVELPGPNPAVGTDGSEAACFGGEVEPLDLNGSGPDFPMAGSEDPPLQPAQRTVESITGPSHHSRVPCGGV